MAHSMNDTTIEATQTQTQAHIQAQGRVNIENANANVRARKWQVRANVTYPPSWTSTTNTHARIVFHALLYNAL